MLPGTTTIVIYGHEKNNNLLKEDKSLYFQFNTVGGVYPHTKLAVMAKWRDLFQNAVFIRNILLYMRKIN